MNNIRLFYIWDENLIEESNRLPAVLGRASLVNNLIEAYGLLNKIKVVRSSSASYEHLRKFHSELYLDHLKKFRDIQDHYMTNSQDEEYGIGYDCPPVSNMFELVSTIAGGSLTAAKCLMLGMADVAINWCGGWHHAHRFGADGFCYVNDIVIAIEKLLKKFPKILYIDLDVHHGNGVQDAYSSSKSVFTLSFHKYEPGFYPGTGHVNDIGSSKGKGYSCNFPLHELYSDDTIEYAFENVFSSVYSYFNPDAIVVQCGADALARDPHGGAQLTTRGYCSCVRMVLDKRKPTMLLGGGGYKHTNAARLWTSITAMVAGVDLEDSIPEHDDWPNYGPDYMLTIEPTLAKDSNKKQYLDDCISKINDNLEKHLGVNANCTNIEPEVKKQKTDSINSKDEINVACVKQENCFRQKCIYNVSEVQTPTEKNEDVYEFID